MSTSTTWPGGVANPTPTSYSVPAAGEVNWANLSNFLNALAGGAQGVTFQKFANRVATTTPVTVSTNDCVVVCKLAVAGAVAVTLPAGANKLVYWIVDGTGDAKTNHITITPNGAETIAGSATYVMNGNRQTVGLIFNSSTSNWNIFANSVSDGGSIGGFTASRAIVSDSGGYLTSATTTSTQIGYLSASTGTTGTTSTNLVFSTSPTLVTPTLGVATATSLNKLTITAPATSATLTIADGKTLTVSNSLTFTGTDTNSFAFPTGSSTVMTLASADSITGVKTFADGKLVLSGSSSGASTIKAQAAAGTTTFTMPTTTGTLVGSGDTGTVTSTMILDGTILNADINASAAIAVTKLAAGSNGNVLTTTGGVPTWAAPATSGTVTSVAMTVPTFLSIGGSPITSSGTLAVTLSGTALPVLNGGTGTTTATGSAGAVVLSSGPTISGLIMTSVPNLQSSMTVGTTGVATGISSTTVRSIGNKSASIQFTDVTSSGETDVMGNIYYDGTNFKYTTLNQTGGIYSIVPGATLATVVHSWSAGSSASSAADSTVTLSTLMTLTANGSLTLSQYGTGILHSSSSGVVTSSTIVNADVNASAGIVYSKLSLSNSIVNADIATGAAIAYSKLTLTGSIVNADVGAAAAIAGTKISPDFGSQNITTSGTSTGGSAVISGTGDGTATTSGGTFRGSDRTGSNAVGSDLIVRSGNGTGNAGSGNLLFQTAPVAASSSTADTFQSNGVCAANGTWRIGPTVATQAAFSGNTIRGVSDATAATTGFVGEYLEISSAALANFTTSGQWAETAAGALALTAGDWDISAIGYTTRNGATVTSVGMLIGTATGNNTTGQVLGSNIAVGPPPIAGDDVSLTIPPYRVNISGSTNYYCKFQAVFAVATPQYAYRMSARRVR